MCGKKVLLFSPKHTSGYQFTNKTAHAPWPTYEAGVPPNDRSKIDQRVSWQNPCHKEVELLSGVQG